MTFKFRDFFVIFFGFLLSGCGLLSFPLPSSPTKSNTPSYQALLTARSWVLTDDSPCAGAVPPGNSRKITFFSNGTLTVQDISGGAVVNTYNGSYTVSNSAGTLSWTFASQSFTGLIQVKSNGNIDLPNYATPAGCDVIAYHLSQ